MFICSVLFTIVGCGVWPTNIKEWLLAAVRYVLCVLSFYTIIMYLNLNSYFKNRLIIIHCWFLLPLVIDSWIKAPCNPSAVSDVCGIYFITVLRVVIEWQPSLPSHYNHHRFSLWLGVNRGLEWSCGAVVSSQVLLVPSTRGDRGQAPQVHQSPYL